MMVVVHDALRRDLTRLTEAIGHSPAARRRSPQGPAEHAEWMMNFLEDHHHGEDSGPWPLLRERAPRDHASLDRVTADHQRIVPAIEQNRLAAEQYRVDADARARLLGALANPLGPGTDPRPDPQRILLPDAGRNVAGVTRVSSRTRPPLASGAERCDYASSVSQPPRTVFFVASSTAGTVTAYAVTETPATQLQQVQVIEVGADVAALALHPTRAVLYASVRATPAVIAMSIDERSGRLEPIADVRVSSPLVSLAVDPAAGCLFGASYRDHVVVSIALDDRGIPATQASDVFAVGSHPHCIVPAHDGSVWVSVLGDDVMLRVPVDGRGRFSRVGIRTTQLPEGFGPRHLVDAPGRREILVIGERSGDIARIATRDGEVTGRWSTLPPEAGLAPGIVRELDRENATVDADGRPLTWAADIALSVNEDVVYSCERRTSLLSISSVSAGELRRSMPTEEQPRGIALDPDGRYLLVTGELAATVTMYAVDPDDGDLEPIAHAPVPAGALWVESLTLATG